MILASAEAKKVLDRAMKLCTAKDVVVHLRGGTERNTRFAVGEVTTAGDAEDVELTVTVAFGRKHANASTNQLDDASLKRVVESAEEMAQLAPEDPEHVPMLGAQKYGKPVAAAHDPATASYDAVRRAQAAASCLAPAAQAGLSAAGFLATAERFSAVASAAGMFGYDQSTHAQVSCTFRTRDGSGSGWAAARGNRVADLDFARVAQRATDKAQRSQQPTALDPGGYVAVLEPAAVADMASYLSFQMDARSADEGRSFFSRAGGETRVGEKLLGDMTLESNPGDPLVPSQRFDGDGLPLGKMVWFDAGTLKSLHVSRFWAQKHGLAPTGMPTNLILRRAAGKNGTLEDMIASTERGVLVTRFWYVRFLEPERVSLTGLTRDGTFLIENGKIKRPIKNFRFNQEVVACLAGAQMVSDPVRVVTSESALPMAVPAIKTARFNFASISEAV
jgi:predicted Zn-dependent protease